MSFYTEIKSVIVKKNDAAFCGILLGGKYILISSHLVNINKNSSKSGYWVIQKDSKNNHFISQEAFLIGKLGSKNIEKVVNKYFVDIYDFNGTISDNVDLFMIYVLSFDECVNDVEDVRALWHLNNVEHQNVKIADEIFIRAAPFGSRQLINSYSQGIISNHVCGILFTDCPTVFGCEGGIILSKTSQEPLGIVVSSMAGWRGEWTGLTLGITFDAIFRDILGKNSIPVVIRDCTKNIGNSLVYVRCGVSWGTGICIDKKTGVILTNAHVINDGHDDILITLQSGKTSHAKTLFKVPNGQHFDLALLKCENPKNLQELQAVTFSHDELRIGDSVYAHGFPLFPHGFHLPPTITQGHVALLKDNVLMTTCTVLPGASGGALCNAQGHLVGIVTCNIMNNADNCSYPRVNMSIPLTCIRGILEQYLQTKDSSVLDKLILNETDDINHGWHISKL